MKFPFSITQRIVLNQTEQKISSVNYVRNHVEESLRKLDMSIERINDDELFLRKTDFIKSYRKKDVLRNLNVKILIDQSTVQIILKTETIVIFIFGLVPFIFLLAPRINAPYTFPIITTSFIWIFGFFSKFVVLQEVKNELKLHLKRMNNH